MIEQHLSIVFGAIVVNRSQPTLPHLCPASGTGTGEPGPRKTRLVTLLAPRCPPTFSYSSASETVPRSDTRTTHAPSTDDRFSVPLRGIAVDPDTRCAHYDGDRDVIAIQFACCGVYYPCFKCHRATTAHAPTRWPAERKHEPAVLCGVCGTTLSALDYRSADHACPHCGAAFNPGCLAHWNRYFAFD